MKTIAIIGSMHAGREKLYELAREAKNSGQPYRMRAYSLELNVGNKHFFWANTPERVMGMLIHDKILVPDWDPETVEMVELRIKLYEARTNN